jgi:phosphatidylserine synthase 2
LDEFVIAHVLGWYAKSLILRDYWFCWILSILFEVCEYSLQHQLPNFAECWWDHWIVDVLVCNWAGTYLGMKTCEHWEMKAYSWRGIRQLPGYKAKMKRAVQQFTPHSWTKFTWGSTRTFPRYIAVLLLLAGVLITELNAFYLKYILWIPPAHPLNTARLVLVFFCSMPAVREAYQYLHDDRCSRFGAQAWLMVTIVCTEVLICIKYDPALFQMPFPAHVVHFWTFMTSALVVYPLWRFAILPRFNSSSPLSRSKQE